MSHSWVGTNYCILTCNKQAYDANSAFIWFSLFLELSGPRVSSYLSLAGCSILYCTGEVFLFVSGALPWEPIGSPFTTITTIVRGSRLAIISLLFGISAGALVPFRRMHGETSPLLGNGPPHRNSNSSVHGDTQYGAISRNQHPHSLQDARREDGTNSNLRKTAVCTTLVRSMYRQQLLTL